jgi:hypothetical protein
MTRTHGKYVFLAVAAWVGIAGAASCLSGDDAPAGGRVEHPPRRAPMPVTSAKGAQDASSPPREGSFTPLDQAIADDCPEWPKEPRAWSQNVPDRDCMNDGECGDGFCDRGHCAAIWTCYVPFGQRCVNGRTVPSSRQARGDRCICLDGRCQSCQSDAECEKEYGKGRACAGRGWGGRRYCGLPGPKAGLGDQQAPPD